MPQDWSADVKKYAPNANPAAINGIIKHLGIALQKRDSSLVACADKAERDRIRDHFLKKQAGAYPRRRRTRQGGGGSLPENARRPR